jgi:hypothetical protein
MLSIVSLCVTRKIAQPKGKLTFSVKTPLLPNATTQNNEVSHHGLHICLCQQCQLPVIFIGRTCQQQGLTRVMPLTMTKERPTMNACNWWKTHEKASLEHGQRVSLLSPCLHGEVIC